MRGGVGDQLSGSLADPASVVFERSRRGGAGRGAKERAGVRTAGRALSITARRSTRASATNRAQRPKARPAHAASHLPCYRD